MYVKEAREKVKSSTEQRKMVRNEKQQKKFIEKTYDNLCTWKIYEEPNTSYGKIINVKYILNNLENLRARIFILIYSYECTTSTRMFGVCV